MLLCMGGQEEEDNGRFLASTAAAIAGCCFKEGMKEGYTASHATVTTSRQRRETKPKDVLVFAFRPVQLLQLPIVGAVCHYLRGF